ncbi:MAG: stage 0 sporulation family protein [Actinobacteria bacterium]|nr:stage 0 sporulation family protein [Actinomycetota bacterium]
MADVVGIVFQKGGKVYYFDPASAELTRGEQVVVQTMRGTEIGEVVDPPHEIPDGDLPAPLKRVVRKASSGDLEAVVANRTLRDEAMRACRRMIAEHNLNMKLVDAEIMLGGGKVTFSFCSEERVDFRALVSDLAKVLKTRIELRQIGAREEARIIGGLGPCGRHLCCATFQGDQDPVSIRMAKEQGLPLNPMKISGLCGRLMCCLKYEHEQYLSFRREAPNRGTRVLTDAGEGTVVGFQVTRESLTVRLDEGGTFDAPISRCACGGKPCAAPREGEEDTPIGTALPAQQQTYPADSGMGEVGVSPLAPGTARAAGEPGASGESTGEPSSASTVDGAPPPGEGAPSSGGKEGEKAAAESGDGDGARRRGGRSRGRRRGSRSGAAGKSGAGSADSGGGSTPGATQGKGQTDAAGSGDAAPGRQSSGSGRSRRRNRGSRKPSGGSGPKEG